MSNIQSSSPPSTSIVSDSPLPDPNSEFSSSPILAVHPKTPPPPQLPDRPSDHSPTKKPRWSAYIKRSATNLAAAFSTNSPPLSLPSLNPITTQSEFRRNFLKLHKDRLLRDNAGSCFRLLPVVMNGDCGFSAIAKGVNIARHYMSQSLTPQNPSHSSSESRLRKRRFWFKRKPTNTKRTLQAKDIRSAMYAEIRKAKKAYLMDSEGFGAVFSDDDFDKLERDVGRAGIAGHWLGTVLGVFEHVLVANAMNINIFLYQFDLQRQCIRQFERAPVDNPACDVHLFFTGPAACGHFDTLIKMVDPKECRFVA